MAHIKINDIEPFVQYVATASQTVFVVPFPFFADEDITVYRDDDYENPVSSSDYTLSGAGNTDASNNGGTLTMDTGETVGAVITILRESDIKRTTDFTDGGDWTANNVNDQLDRLVTYVQEIRQLYRRTVQLPPTSQLQNIIFPGDLTGHATKVLIINDDEDGITLGPTTTDITDLSEIITEIEALSAIITEIEALYAIRTDISGVYAIRTDVTVCANNSANITTVADDLNGDDTIGTCAANMAAILAAPNEADDAAAAAVAAQAALAATLAAFDNFDDRYLGAKAADPTLDNDGDPLLAGSLYFNTVDTVMKIYTGSIWVAAYVSGTDFLATINNLSDLTNVVTARNNLNLGTADTVQFTGINLGHATDTTITRVSAGVIAVEGSNVLLVSGAGTTHYAPGGADVVAADGGTGRSSHTAYAVICGGTTTTDPQQSIASVGTAGQVLTSNGPGALPTFQDSSAAGRLINIQIIEASGNWTKPAGIAYAEVEIIGSGSTGGGGTTSRNYGGGAGNTSSFGSHISCPGGAGGPNNNTDGSGAVGGGAPTIAGTVIDGGDVIINGSNGDAALVNGIGANGGDSPLGFGGKGSTGNGTDAVGFGSGGASGQFSSNTNAGGGAAATYVKGRILAADLGATETVTIGAQAAAATTTPAAGDRGGRGAPAICIVRSYS